MALAALGADLSSRLADDARAVDNLRLLAKKDGNAAIKAAAQQFESLFLGILFKSMRESLPGDDLFESEQTKMFTQMFDQQLAQKISTTHGIGLADTLARQLTQNGVSPGAVLEETAGERPAPVPLKREDVPVPLEKQKPVPLNREGVQAILLAKPDRTAAPASGAVTAAPSSGDHRKDFVNKVWPHAVDAARELGVSPLFLVGQAALESGWGKSETRGADGRATHNLFNIKATGGWQGEVAFAATTEYVNGKAQARTEGFRAYGSYKEAFSDYVALLKNNPRYAAALENGRDAAAFARELQKAGYATDPQYADKLTRVIQSGSFREALAG